jgi:hypothetical protein
MLVPIPHRLSLFYCRPFLPRRLLPIVLMLLAVGQSWAGTYPEWFLFPQRYDSTCVVGFSGNAASPLIDAARTAIVYQQCLVSGRLEYYQVREENIFARNSDYYYYFPADSLPVWQRRLKVHDAFQLSTFTDDLIVLFSPLDSLAHLRKWLDSDSLALPAWRLQSTWSDSLYYHGVGVSSAVGRPNAAWKVAEEKAIFNILTAQAVDFHQIRYQQSDTEGGRQLEEVSFLDLRFKIKGIEVVERWPDSRYNEYLVYVRIPRQGLWWPGKNDK